MFISPDMWDGFFSYLVYDKKHDDSKKNVQRRKSTFLLLCKYFEGKEFNRTNFTGFIRYLLEKGYSKEYANTFIKLAKHLDRYLEVNQLNDYSMFPKQPKVIDVLSYDQIKDMANVHVEYKIDTTEKNLKYKSLIYLLMLTGARISEILDLTWSDVHENPYSVVINQSKSNNYRIGGIDKETYDLIQQLPHNGGYVFCSAEGNRLDDTTINLELKRRAELVGIKKRVYNHLLRHSFVNIMLREGMPMHLVSELVGHKDISTTYDYYTHILKDELIDALYMYHPHLRQNQTLASIKKRLNTFLQSVVNKDKYEVNISHNDSEISIDIKEHGNTFSD